MGGCLFHQKSEAYIARETNMRTWITAAAIAFTLTASAAVEGPKSDKPRENVGVGLGTMVFDGNDGLVEQCVATWLNMLICNQTFAITSGTSGAKKWDKFVMNGDVQNFVKNNMDTLARDMARGSGESLDTLAELMNVPEADRAAFAKDTQANFVKIYSSAKVTHDQVVKNIKA